MNMILIYIIENILKQIAYFFKHWYVDGFWFVYRQYTMAIRRFDRKWALFTTVKNMFKPLYQDYSFAGYFIGIGFRFARSLFAGFVYLIITFIFAVAFFAWVMLLPSLIFQIFK